MSRTVQQNSGLVLSAIQVGEKYIEQAQRRRFDENGSATIPDNFTSVKGMGPDYGESYSNFDDIDDFDGYTTIDNKSAHIPLEIKVQVYYVSNTPPHKVSNSRTNFKKIRVTVSSPYFSGIPENSVIVSRVFGFHWFWTDGWE